MKVNDFSYQENAAEKAAESNQDALTAREQREKYREQDRVLNGWSGVMANVSPVKATVIAIVMVMLNMVTAWEMNWDLIDQTGLFQSFGWETPPFWSPLIIALPLEALALWVATWLGKAYIEDIFEWNVWNKIHLSGKGDYHRPLVVSQTLKTRTRARFWFWVLLVLVLVAQGGISWHRIQVIENNSVAVLLAVLAFIFLLGEVIAGVYLDYLLKRWSRARRRNKSWKAFRRHMALCAQADRMVFELVEKGRSKGETITLNGDMKRSVYRHKRRGQDEESYVDEIAVKQITVEVRTSDNSPLSDARVIGLLPGGSSTNAGYTNSKGMAAVYWEGNADSLERIKINGFEYLGPFGKDMVHRLRLPLPPGKQPLALTGS